MQVSFIKTQTVSDTKYVDLIEVDGKMYTFLMKKSAEPNLFDVEKREDGDTFDNMISENSGG